MLISTTHSQGFTLVELLIVVAIICILSAIAIPQLTQYRADAQVARVQSDLTTCIKEAAAEYTDQGSIEGNKPSHGSDGTVSEADSSHINFICRIDDNQAELTLNTEDGVVNVNEDNGSEYIGEPGESIQVDEHVVFAVDDYQIVCGVMGGNNRVVCDNEYGEE